MAAKVYQHTEAFGLELGGELNSLEIAYHTYGELTPGKRVIWVCHALTANSDCEDWWSGLVGDGRLFDPAHDFIVCANIIGSCYGSSGPLSTNPATDAPYFASFPEVTIRDMVRAHDLLRLHLGINRIDLALGGSMGGYQILEWSLLRPSVIQRMALLVTSAQESAWGIAIHTSQRLAIEADPTWKEDRPDAGRNGLIAARGVGMLTYRNYATFKRTQSNPDERTSDHRAESYIRYQGGKLADRFNVVSYWLLSKAMDSHNIGRGRGSVEETLGRIQVPALVIGITSDFLCPKEEQMHLAQHLGQGTYVEIDSPYGHDGFLIEFEKIGAEIKRFMA